MTFKVVGHVLASRKELICASNFRMRALKASVLAIAEGAEKVHDVVPINDIEKMVPNHLEIAFFPYEYGGPYPGILLFTTVCIFTLNLAFILLPPFVHCGFQKAGIEYLNA